MDLTTITFSAIIITVLLTIYRKLVENRKLPPGPTGVPYLGMYPFIGHETFHQQLTDYTRVYGDLFSFTYSGKLFLNLGSTKSIKEFLLNQTEYFYGRSYDYSVLTDVLGHGVTMSNGEPWKVLKKFFATSFKEYLFDNRDGVIQSLLEDLRSKKDAPLDLVSIFSQRSLDTMRIAMFGEKGISDEQLQTFLKWHDEALDNLSGVNLMLIGPFARLLYYLFPSNKKALRTHGYIRELFLSCVRKIETSFDGEHPTCIIESYYKEKKYKKKRNDPTWKYYTDLALVCSMMQFVGDGTSGVATFAGGFLNALLQNPEEQDKIYAELMEVVGPDRQPSINDRAKLPYTAAVMTEGSRISNFFPMFPSLECSKETTVNGYKIPKGAIILLNFWTAHHDPDVYKDPYRFNPSRFLSKDGKPREETPIQFGVGRRHCNGEGYIMRDTFIYLTTIVKNYRIYPVGDPAKVSAKFLRYANLDVYVRPREEQ